MSIFDATHLSYQQLVEQLVARFDQGLGGILDRFREKLGIFQLFPGISCQGYIRALGLDVMTISIGMGIFV